MECPFVGEEEHVDDDEGDDENLPTVGIPERVRKPVPPPVLEQAEEVVREFDRARGDNPVRSRPPAPVYPPGFFPPPVGVPERKEPAPAPVGAPARGLSPVATPPPAALFPPPVRGRPPARRVAAERATVRQSVKAVSSALGNVPFPRSINLEAYDGLVRGDKVVGPVAAPPPVRKGLPPREPALAPVPVTPSIRAGLMEEAIVREFGGEIDEGLPE